MAEVSLRYPDDSWCQGSVKAGMCGRWGLHAFLSLFFNILSRSGTNKFLCVHFPNNKNNTCSSNTERKWKVKHFSQFLLSLLSLILSDTLFWCILLMKIGSYCTYLVLLPPPLFLDLLYYGLFFMPINPDLPHSAQYCIIYICRSPLMDIYVVSNFLPSQTGFSEHPCTYTFTCLCWELFYGNRRKGRHI